MYAVVAVFESSASDIAAGLGFLRDRIVVNISQEQGFVAGYWTYDEAAERNCNFIVFDDRAAAERRAADIEGNRENQRRAGLELISVSVAEVMASA